MRTFYRHKSYFCNQKSDHQYLYGINPIEMALHTRKRQLFQMLISDSEAVAMNSRIGKLVLKAKEIKIPVIVTPVHKLDRLTRNQPHQNIALKCSALSYRRYEDIFNFQDGVSVFTDKITDPQNFGAILRSCLFFGVKSVFTGRKNHCPLNTTVSKVSSGALELTDVVLVNKHDKFLTEWKNQEGIILSTSISQTSNHYSVQNLSQISELTEKKKKKVLVIMGSENEGVSPHIAQYADYSISIERKGVEQYPFTMVDSLNVNAALTAILFQLTK